MSELSKTTSKKPHPIYTVDNGDSATDLALWHFSLILREIAESLDPDTQKEKPPSRRPAEEP